MNKITSKQHRTRDMETWNRLTAARGEGPAGNGGKKGKELVKEHV